MTIPSRDLPTLCEQVGFQRRAGAAAGAIAQVEAAFGVQLPSEFIELWSLTDGMTGDGIDVLPLSEVEKYSDVFAGGFGYIPFTDCNDSNPYAVCCRDPLRGMILHVYHDAETEIVCRGLDRFLELVAAARVDGEVDRIVGDMAFDVPDRTTEDAATAIELICAAESMERLDEWRTVALRLAAQLLGPGQELELARVLALGDEYTREAVRQRWTALGTPQALALLQEDDAAYRQFLTDLKRAFDFAGIRTEPTRGDGFRLQPGNIGLNFAMLFADCRRPGVMAEWVQRFKDRLKDRES